MIAQTQSVTWNIQVEQTESLDDINDNELADPSYIPQEPTDYKSHNKQAKDRPIKRNNEETKYLVLCSCL